jgi:putative oxidoreductase
MTAAMQTTRALLRIVVGLLFLQHGGQKLFGWFGGLGGSGATAPLGSLMGVAGILEFYGGLLILLGLLTRPVAFLLAGEMAVAYFRQHSPHGFWPIVNHGEPAALYAFIFLFFAAHGAGALSLDSLLFHRHHRVGPEPGHVPESRPHAA